MAAPVLIGIHLALAIIGIDAFIWVIGEVVAESKKIIRIKLAAIIGTASFALSWLVGGYYYIIYYGNIVKPVIQSGLVPWAHLIYMETKEHVFLFIVPLAITVCFISLLKSSNLYQENWRRALLCLSTLIVSLGLAIGLMGFIISAAARWG